MTKRECAIVMAYTGVCMLKGDDLQIFYDYVEEIMGRRLYTHEIGEKADAIKEAAKDDFLKLCSSAEYTYLADAHREIHGMTMVNAFDEKYFKVNRMFIMEEWTMSMPRDNDGNVRYVPLRKKESNLVKVKYVTYYGTVLKIDVLDKDVETTKEIKASQVAHGYYKFIPVKVIREDEECT